MVAFFTSFFLDAFLGDADAAFLGEADAAFLGEAVAFLGEAVATLAAAIFCVIEKGVEQLSHAIPPASQVHVV